MIIINNVMLPLETDFQNIKPIISKELKTDIGNIKDAKLYRKSVDARHKDNIKFCCSFIVSLSKNEESILKKCKNAQIFKEKRYTWQKADKKPLNRPVIVGFGPCGMFAALTLARAGLKPLVFERGSKVEERTKQVEDFFNGAPLNLNSNVQFGEGGAGTFSDGKLNTGIKNPRCKTVLETFHTFGAPQKILTDAKPHIGTDILVSVVKNIRKEVINLGGEILFDTKCDGIATENGKIKSVAANGVTYPCDEIIIATGHSARDTFNVLFENGVKMEQKPFAMGVRIEHLQEDINKSLYGDFWDSEYLGAADYKLWTHLENGRGVYTFCMCPGGEVINSSSEQNALAVNGMSLSERNGKNANSALLVNINPEDFGSDDIFAGCMLQKKIEEKAYSICDGAVPITTVGQFVIGKEAKIGKVKPTVKPKYEFADFKDIFPDFITDSLREGIKIFGTKIKGFDSPDAILTAPETRSSSPVRMMRNENMQSVTIENLYPCGEGAGYAGGIVSAAVDGILAAEKIIEKYKES